MSMRYTHRMDTSKNSEEKNIRAGDVVKLKSGGPLLTVSRSPTEESAWITVWWFDFDAGSFSKQDLPANCLEHAQPPS